MATQRKASDSLHMKARPRTRQAIVADPHASTTAGNYTKIKELKVHGSASVCLVRHTLRGGETLLLKEVACNGLSPTELKATLQEIAILENVSHPNIIALRDAFGHDLLDAEQQHHQMGQTLSLGIITEYLPGGDLQTLIQAKLDESQKSGRLTGVVPFPESTVVQWASQLGEALSYLHSTALLLHRDIKPQNIFLSADHQTVKLGDFGLSKILAHSKDMATSQVGTPLYMSPELCAGKEYDRGADLWALGCTLFEVMSLRPPWHEHARADGRMAGGLMGLLRLIMTSSLDVGSLRKHYSAELCAFLSSLLARKRKDRLVPMATLLARLKQPKAPPASWGLSAAATAALAAMEATEAAARSGGLSPTQDHTSTHSGSHPSSKAASRPASRPTSNPASRPTSRPASRPSSRPASPRVHSRPGSGPGSPPSSFVHRPTAVSVHELLELQRKTSSATPRGERDSATTATSPASISPSHTPHSGGSQCVSPGRGPGTATSEAHGAEKHAAADVLRRSFLRRSNERQALAAATAQAAAAESAAAAAAIAAAAPQLLRPRIAPMAAATAAAAAATPDARGKAKERGTREIEPTADALATANKGGVRAGKRATSAPKEQRGSRSQALRSSTFTEPSSAASAATSTAATRPPPLKKASNPQGSKLSKPRGASPAQASPRRGHSPLQRGGTSIASSPRVTRTSGAGNAVPIQPSNKAEVTFAADRAYANLV